MEFFQVDSDCTLVDWRKGFLGNHLPGMTIDEFNSLHPEKRADLFHTVYNKDINLFRNLEPHHGAVELIEALKGSGKPWGILTAVGYHPDFEIAKQDKIDCLVELFDIPADKIVVVKTSKCKAAYAKPNHCLIDDFKRNCDEWEAAGGSSICVYGDNTAPNLSDAIEFIKGL